VLNFDFLLELKLFHRALGEQRDVVCDFWQRADELLQGSGVELRPMPDELTSFSRNFFSVLFITAFYRLDIPAPRLRLYASINHCLRGWVTACDNLLDSELKELLLTDLPPQAAIFKSVHTLMVTDRIFFSLLRDAVRDGVISEAEMELLLKVSLASLSESGREEANEEGGVEHDLLPAEVLNTIHHAKTGLLFAAPLAAPRALGDIGGEGELEQLEVGLLHFGLACQIVDDLNDVGIDIADQKYNYFIALVMHGEEGGERATMQALIDTADMGFDANDPLLYQRFPAAAALATEELGRQFKTSLSLLGRSGYPFDGRIGRMLVDLLLRILGHPEISVELD